MDKKVYGDDASEIWEKLNSNILTVTPGGVKRMVYF